MIAAVALSMAFSTPSSKPAARSPAVADSAATVKPPVPPTAPEFVSASRMTTALLTVLGLAGIGAWLARRFLRHVRIAPAGAKVLEVVDALPLGQRRQIFVVRAYGRKLVIGASPEGLRLLSEFSDEEVAVAASSDSFASELSDRLAAGGRLATSGVGQ